VIVEEVLDAFAARYDLSVELVRTAEENIVFSLPRSLREAAA
jgi:4-hydroxy-3-methylbut-2-enyl diphosphate reductase